MEQSSPQDNTENVGEITPQEIVPTNGSTSNPTNTGSIPAKQDTPQEDNETVEELKEISNAPEYKITPKFSEWVRCYKTKGITVEVHGKELETWGNCTLSAIKAYNLDPIEQYAHARVLGSRNLAKANVLAREFMEERGYNLYYMLAHAVKKMETSSNGHKWWKELMLMAEYAKETPAIQVKNTQINQQFNGKIDSPEVVDFNKKFLKFIEAEPIS
jgi:hypothetical protein